MDLRRSWILVLCSIAAVEGVFTAKGYYCRDPDTGKLYPVNSTWSSNTFCGSYTCKLRRKNQTDNAVKHIDIINKSFTSGRAKLFEQVAKLNKNCTISDSNTDESRGIEQLLHRDKGDDATYIKLENFKNVELGAQTKDGDRYLTEDEIKALTLFLQTMKKSDLEAILEIYNLAQDIYKEIDRATQLKQESVRKSQQDDSLLVKSEETSDKAHNYVSYWYEPLSSTNNKQKIVDIPVPVLAPQQNDPQAVPVDGPNLLEIPLVKPLPRPAENSQAFFGSPLTHNDFGKLPYYYPVSKFQRLSSYVHPNEVVNVPVVYPQNLPMLPNLQQRNSNNVPAKCSRNSDGAIKKISPWYRIINKPFSFEMEKQIDEKPSSVVTESKVNPIPYPFTYLQYNVSSALPNTNIVVNSVVDNPWSFFNLRDKHHPTPYISASYVAQVPNSYIANSDSVQEIQDEEQKIKKGSGEETGHILPEWQTEPLSANVINDVRANTESKLLPFPFRKKIKLERVEKLMSLDDLTRGRRQVSYSYPVSQDPDEFEVYIEKSTCQTDTEPGFFRMGNASEPYPACCPQRIGS